jgi:tRNA(fMet)-specific endonuclease VapC
VTPPPALVVVDTDVVSFLFRGDTRADLYRPHLAGKVLTLSFMTLAELDQWALEHHWGAARQQRLAEHLADYTIHPYDRDLCRWWATVRVACRRAGQPIDGADAWIAATALLYGIPLVTHNFDHFARVPGLVVISEAAP